MPPVPSRRVGRRPYNGFEVNLYGFLPDHLIQRDQQAATSGIADFWDPGNSRLESLGSPGDTSYTIIIGDPPQKSTVAVFSGPQALADDGEGKLLDGGGIQRGTIDYDTGRVQVDFASTALYEVFITYTTGPIVGTASHWDQEGAIWDRVANQPVIQRTFWAIELDATDLVNRIDAYRDLSYVDTISEENAQYAFEGYGFDGQIVDLDVELSRAWLRSMSTQWQLKSSLRMWRRLLQNLGFTARVFELYKTHPLNNYGENPGEIYSRVLEAISLEQQELYERALEQAGFDPTSVPLPTTGPSVTHVIGVGSNSEIMGVQVPVILDAPDWSTITFELSSISSGVDPETLTLDPATGEVTGDLGATGRIDLFSGSGQIDFGRILTTEFSLTATYTVLGTAYQAARVDVEIELDDSVPYKSGDRAAKAVIRALDFVRPIHVLIRLLDLGLIEEETAIISEGSCCGPNIVDLVEYTYPTAASAELAPQPAGGTVYGGALLNSPVVPKTFKVSETISGFTLEDNGLGGMFGDGTGVIDYNLGIWWVQFNSPTAAVPNISYNYYKVNEADADAEHVRYLADMLDMGEARFDRSHAELAVTYADEDVDSDYKVLAPDFVAGTNYAGVLHTDLRPNQVFIRDDETGQLITDDGAGNLVGDVDGGGTNTVNYTTGAYDVDFLSAPTDPLAVFQFDDVGAHDPNQEDLHFVLEDNPKIEGDYISMSVDSPGSSEAVGSSGTDVYSGTLTGEGLVPGTVVFREDPGAAQSVSDGLAESAFSGDGNGTINYVTGTLAIAFGAVTVGAPVAKYTVIDGNGFEQQLETPIGPAGLVVYNAVLVGGQIVPGSVIVEDEDSGQSLQDDAVVALLGNGIGTLNYVTGDYSITFTVATVDDVIAEYDQVLVLVF
jgi:hypothetical protein